jgi:acyl dehydratase
MNRIQVRTIYEGADYDLGTIVLSESDIIEYGKLHDPLDIHIDKEAARMSMFGDLIASGRQLFDIFHKNTWVPMFGHSVVCGIEVEHWKFNRPTYANVEISARVKVLHIKKNVEKKHMVITWCYVFKDNQKRLLQSLRMLVLHRLNEE